MRTSKQTDTLQLTVGYVCAVVLGTTLAMAYFITKRQRIRRQELLEKLLLSFHDSATFFAFSIQVASTVVLARVDYGLSTALMGDITVQITWTVSALTLLPLLYTLILIDKPRESTRGIRVTDANILELDSRYRLLLFVFCWALSVYPFMSRMIETFGTSLIGDDPGDAVTNADWAVIETVCLAGTDTLNASESAFINAFGITGSLLISIFAIIHILAAGMRKHYPDLAQRVTAAVNIFVKAQHIFEPMLFLLVPLLSAGLLWSYFRLQRFQSQVSTKAGLQDSDNQWTFGQIVAVVVFAPVLGEALLGLYEIQHEDPEEPDDMFVEEMVDQHEASGGKRRSATA